MRCGKKKQISLPPNGMVPLLVYRPMFSGASQPFINSLSMSETDYEQVDEAAQKKKKK